MWITGTGKGFVFVDEADTLIKMRLKSVQKGARLHKNTAGEKEKVELTEKFKAVKALIKQEE